MVLGDVIARESKTDPCSPSLAFFMASALLAGSHKLNYWSDYRLITPFPAANDLVMLQFSACVVHLTGPKMSLVIKPNFQHILRVMNTNIDGKRNIMFAMTAIKGIGRR